MNIQKVFLGKILCVILKTVLGIFSERESYLKRFRAVNTFGKMEFCIGVALNANYPLRNPQFGLVKFTIVSATRRPFRIFQKENNIRTPEAISFPSRKMEGS